MAEMTDHEWTAYCRAWRLVGWLWVACMFLCALSAALEFLKSR